MKHDQYAQHVRWTSNGPIEYVPQEAKRTVSLEGVLKVILALAFAGLATVAFFAFFM